MGIIVCSFDQRVGWRVKRREAEGDTRIRVIVEDGRKLLVIPAIRLQRAGHFCNPAKLAVEWTRTCGYSGSVESNTVPKLLTQSEIVTHRAIEERV